MEINQIIEEYKKGESATAIAKGAGRCSSTIYNILDEAGVKRRTQKESQKTINIPKDDLKILYCEKQKSLKEIGDVYDCSDGTIRNLCIKYNIKRRSRTENVAGWNRGKRMSDEQRRHLSSIRKQQFATGELKHWNKGNTWSEETKDKISKSLKGKCKGENNARWKGGVNTPNQQLRDRLVGGYQYKKWRGEVYERDNYTCQLCGKESNGDLEGHHILPFSENHDLIFDVDNGVALCKNCHRQIRHKENEYITYFTNKIKENKNE